MSYLNQELSFDEVRWATTRKTSYDSRASFVGAPRKTLLPVSTNLFRLVHLATTLWFDGVWWMPEAVFKELHDEVNRSAHGSGRLLRNYVAEYMALPKGDTQLCVIEIQLKTPVYGWVGQSAPLMGRPGGMEQVYLPNLAQRGDPKFSDHARKVQSYWLKF